MKKPAFIIGNGTSRLQLDLERIKSKGVTFGCNVLYRDFSPHYLVAIDRKVQKEIIGAEYYKENKVLFRVAGNDSYIPKHSNIYKFKERISSPNNSGMAAIWFAMKAGYRNIYLIGFDFETPSQNKQLNVYAGTPCYERHGARPPKVPMNIPKTLIKWADNNKNVVAFTRVIDPEISNLKVESENIKHITYGEFNELY